MGSNFVPVSGGTTNRSSRSGVNSGCDGIDSMHEPLPAPGNLPRGNNRRVTVGAR